MGGIIHTTIEERIKGCTPRPVLPTEAKDFNLGTREFREAISHPAVHRGGACGDMEQEKDRD